MHSYSQREVFTEQEMAYYNVACELIRAIPDVPKLRCHEVSRAVAKFLNLRYQDGFYGMVEHTWLWIGDVMPRFMLRTGCILDVYAVGRLPQVQLIDYFYGLPHSGNYNATTERSDIDHNLVDYLYKTMVMIDAIPKTEIVSGEVVYQVFDSSSIITANVHDTMIDQPKIECMDHEFRDNRCQYCGKYV